MIRLRLEQHQNYNSYKQAMAKGRGKQRSVVDSGKENQEMSGVGESVSTRSVGQIRRNSIAESIEIQSMANTMQSIPSNK